MAGKSIQNLDPRTLRNFVHGKSLLESYLSSGKGEDLQEAENNFASAVGMDQEFDLAMLYLAATQTELRKPDSAIQVLSQLEKKNNEFMPDVYIQLSYAYLKKYKDPFYRQATEMLDKASLVAKERDRKELLWLIDAYRVFVLAVSGGRSKEMDCKQLLEEAVERGRKLLAKLRWRSQKKNAVALFETLNGMGIAYMWKGKSETKSVIKQDHLWTLAEQFYKRALTVRPNSVRALQNLGTLELFRGDQLRHTNQFGKAIERYEISKRLYRRSISLNPYDQFPHYRLALLYAKTGNWENAAVQQKLGEAQSGAVKLEQWQRLREAILNKNPDVLD